MAKIVFVDSERTERPVEAMNGHSVMEAARKNSIPGILAECGGACACGTCHVYVDEAWLAAVGEKQVMETEMLEYAIDVRPNSRLACQIKVLAACEGLIIRTPERQV